MNRLKAVGVVISIVCSTYAADDGGDYNDGDNIDDSDDNDDEIYLNKTTIHRLQEIVLHKKNM